VTEFVEMMLGALGRDAVGMGSGITHPRLSPEWAAMGFRERMEFFAPVWRIMRNSNMTVDGVIGQIAYVARAVKTGSEVSDLRRHRFTGRLRGARVVFLRGSTRGACDYISDGRRGREAYGPSWAQVADHVEVHDVPGDHFSLLRTDGDDAGVLAEILRAHLVDFGWPVLGAGAGAAGPGAALRAAQAMDASSVSAQLREMGADAAAIQAAQR